MQVQNVLNAFELSIPESQSWDDVLTVNLTRDQMGVLLAVVTMQFGTVSDGLAVIERSAKKGDLIALMAGPAVVESAHKLQDVMRVLAEAFDPDMYAKVMAEDATDKAIRDALAADDGSVDGWEVGKGA